MAHRIIANTNDLSDLFKLFGGLKLPITVEWVQGRDRTPDQNRLQFLWAKEAAEQRGDMTPDEVRCEWKLRHGVPILREETHASTGFVTAMLMLYGIGLTIGNTLGGRLADRSIERTLMGSFVVLATVLVVFAGVMQWPWPAAVAILIPFGVIYILLTGPGQWKSIR